MIAAPWYLFAFGIFLVVVGMTASKLCPPGNADDAKIDPQMSDRQIAEELRRRTKLHIPSVITLTGLICVLLSVGWRLLRFFV